MVRAPQTDGRPAWKLVPTGQHFDPNMSTRASGSATVATAHLMASICGC
jgi:hypothetical protein